MTELQLTLTPKESSEESELKKVISNKLKVHINQISHIQLVKKSIDSRSRQPLVLLKVRVFLDEERPQYQYENTFHYGDVSKKPAVIIVGSGPAGLFAALRLIGLGLRPIVFERGKEVSERKKDIAQLNRNTALDVESNYCFG